MRTIAILLAAAAIVIGQPAAIEGRVVNALSGDPLRKVTLTLSKPGSQDDPATAISDDSGRFAFRDLAPGDYRLSGERAGYSRQSYGARLNPQSGARLRVSAGQTLQGLVFKLVPNSILSGRVIDDSGEPMPNLVVSVLRSGYVSGSRRWVRAGGGQTNDRGEFRIANLRSGRYLVAAIDLNIGIGLAGISNETLPEKPDIGHAPTYFGNTADVNRAVPIELGMGDDRRGVDIRLAKTPTLRIRGTVTGAPEGKPMLVALVRKSTTFGTEEQSGMALVQAEGKFEVKGVTPGSYLLVAQAIGEGSSGLAAAMPIELGDRHLDGVTVPMNNSVELPGKITGVAKPTGITVRAQMVDFNLPNPPRAQPAADGTFVLKNVFAGRYRVRLDDVPPEAYLKEVKVGGRQVDPNAAEFTGRTEIEIVLSPTAAHVEGTVAGSDEKPLPNATVALIPENGNEFLYRSETTGPDGAFKIDGIAPGKYKLAAWEAIEAGAWEDSDVIKRLGPNAQAVTLAGSERVKLQLRAIPAAEKKE